MHLSKLIVTGLLIFFSISAYTQHDPSALNGEDNTEEEVSTSCITTAPVFPAPECKHLERHEQPDCGKRQLMAFIYSEIEYPKEAKERNLQGRVYLRLTIDRQGKIADAQILGGPGGGCEEEVLRVVEKMKELPAWTPGWNCWTKSYERMSFTIPIQFKIEYKLKKEKEKER